jgi:PKD repeat protein
VETLALYVDGALRTGSSVAFLTYALDTRSLGPGSHTLTATATDRAGNQAATACTVIVQNLSVRIIAPLDGASISQDRVRVSGTVEGQGEIGVLVNGVLAFVCGSQWAAEVPLALGGNDIAVTATDATGAQDTRHISVQVTQVQPPPVALKASPASGLAPLTVRFEVQSGLDRPIVKYEFDQNGDGTIDLTAATFENTEVTYTTPGLITPTLTVTDDQGRTTTVATTVQVLDAVAFDSLLQAKWTGLKAALRRGDVAQALPYIFTAARSRYEAIFRALPLDLPDVDTILTGIALLEVRGAEALYEMARTEGGVTRSFEIRFRLDEDGRWRLWMF